MRSLEDPFERVSRSSFVLCRGVRRELRRHVVLDSILVCRRRSGVRAGPARGRRRAERCDVDHAPARERGGRERGRRERWWWRKRR